MNLTPKRDGLTRAERKALRKVRIPARIAGRLNTAVRTTARAGIGQVYGIAAQVAYSVWARSERGKLALGR